ncbi:hypothetical protein D3C87_1087470 [compost metagenome]
MAVILSWSVVSAQSVPMSLASPAMTQADWKVVLKGLKSRNPEALKNLSIDKKSIRVDGPGTSGGGNESDAEFNYLAGQIFSDFESGGIKTPILTTVKQALEKLKLEKSVFFTDKELFLDEEPKTAINDYDVFVIIFNEPRWNKSTFAQKRRLIVHELLGLARAFDPNIDDSTYEISNGLFEKLDVANQKDFLTKSDYPLYFKLPTNLNMALTTQESMTITQNGISQACSSVDNEPTIRMENKTSVKDGRQKINLSFRISCRLANGKMFGHTNNIDDLLEVVSGNLLYNKSDYGIFLLGWVSGDEFIVKAPAWINSLRETTDGSLEFNFAAKFGDKQEAYRAIFKRK